MFLKMCKAHLEQARETYFQHFFFAFAVGAMLVAAGLACILHALIPACCTRTASTTVGRLARLFDDRRDVSSTLQDISGALTLVGLLVLALPSCGLLLMAPFAGSAAAAVALLPLAIPTTYLWTNPQLEPVA